jgi:short-subunit dehydrogenase
MSQHAAVLMRKNGGGSIVNVSSINGRIPMLKQSIYSITKADIFNPNLS